MESNYYLCWLLDQITVGLRMKNYLVLAIMVIIFSGYLRSMENKSDKDNIIYFNIGGYHWDTYASTIKIFGGDYLNIIIGNKFKKIKDSKNRIFIDRNPEEARLISYYISTQSLPENFDFNIAKNAAEYFSNNSMIDYLNKYKINKIKPVKSWTYLRSFFNQDYYESSCPECNNFNPVGLAEAILHLTDIHQAQIKYWHENLNNTVNSIGWRLLYQMPSDY